MAERGENRPEFVTEEQVQLGASLFARALLLRYMAQGINPKTLPINTFLQNVGDIVREASHGERHPIPQGEDDEIFNALRGKPATFYWEVLGQVPEIAKFVGRNDKAFTDDVVLRLRHISLADNSPRLELPANVAIPAILQRFGMLPPRLQREQ